MTTAIIPVKHYKMKHYWNTSLKTVVIMHCETSSTLSLPLAFCNQWTTTILCCANSKLWVSQIEHQSSVPAKSQDDVTLNPAPLHRAA